MIPKVYNDRARAVIQIQLWLRTLAATGLPIPTLVPDGIYDDKTRQTVAIFQGLSGIAATGEVDYVTWLALRDDYRRAVAAKSRSMPIYPFEYALEGGTVGEGDTLSLVSILQAMIGDLSSVYALPQEQRTNGVYDEETVQNVRSLQEIWQLPQTGRVDKETWNMLAGAYNKNLNKE
ncbi:MAG: peptidoglycan-binding protein [Clostridia bacterium]|nr:peptidoglycan-binding protein [Clostridia bacterium]MBQ9129180.1 peptidoglycan-binding protein [Clostridia bacterium]